MGSHFLGAYNVEQTLVCIKTDPRVEGEERAEIYTSIHYIDSGSNQTHHPLPKLEGKKKRSVKALGSLHGQTKKKVMKKDRKEGMFVEKCMDWAEGRHSSNNETHKGRKK